MITPINETPADVAAMTRAYLTRDVEPGETVIFAGRIEVSRDAQEPRRYHVRTDGGAWHRLAIEEAVRLVLTGGEEVASPLHIYQVQIDERARFVRVTPAGALIETPAAGARLMRRYGIVGGYVLPLSAPEIVVDEQPDLVLLCLEQHGLKLSDGDRTALAGYLSDCYADGTPGDPRPVYTGAEGDPLDVLFDTLRTVAFEVRRHSGRTGATWRVVLRTTNAAGARLRYGREAEKLRQGGVRLYRITEHDAIQLAGTAAPRLRRRW